MTLLFDFFEIPNKALIERWILNFEVQLTKCDLRVVNRMYRNMCAKINYIIRLICKN